MITLQDVTRRYPSGSGAPISAVCQVSLVVEAGRFLIITGRSGSGKTTLLNLMAGLTRPTSGIVYVDGADLWHLTDGQRATLRNQRLGFVFQFPSLLSSLTARENVALPALFGASHRKADAYRRASELLEVVGLAAKRDSLPRQLSAGQQQRVVIARALINQPAIVLADEPTSNLDETTEQEIMALFRRIHAGTGVTVVMVTHTTQLIHFGTHAMTMSNGHLVAGALQPVEA